MLTKANLRLSCLYSCYFCPLKRAFELKSFAIVATSAPLTSMTFAVPRVVRSDEFGAFGAFGSFEFINNCI